jgi:hypothetical protein
VFPHSGVTLGFVGGQIAVQDLDRRPALVGTRVTSTVLATALSLQPRMRLLAHPSVQLTL